MSKVIVTDLFVFKTHGHNSRCSLHGFYAMKKFNITRFYRVVNPAYFACPHAILTIFIIIRSFLFTRVSLGYISPFVKWKEKKVVALGFSDFYFYRTILLIAVLLSNPNTIVHHNVEGYK